MDQGCVIKYMLRTLPVKHHDKKAILQRSTMEAASWWEHHPTAKHGGSSIEMRIYPTAQYGRGSIMMRGTWSALKNKWKKQTCFEPVGVFQRCETETEAHLQNWWDLMSELVKLETPRTDFKEFITHYIQDVHVISLTFPPFNPINLNDFLL